MNLNLAGELDNLSEMFKSRSVKALARRTTDHECVHMRLSLFIHAGT